MKKLFFLASLFAALAFVLTNVGYAQDPTKVAPDQYKLLFENDRVRVLEVRTKPGETVPTHSHPDHLGYCVGPAKIKITNADGKSEVADCKDGQVLWMAAVTHSAENVGTTDLRIVVVELK